MTASPIAQYLEQKRVVRPSNGQPRGAKAPRRAPPTPPVAAPEPSNGVRAPAFGRVPSADGRFVLVRRPRRPEGQ